MTSRSEAALHAARAEAKRVLSPAEVREYLATPISDFERQQVVELVTWFRHRYPTVGERLAYARRAHARWTDSTEAHQR